MSTPTPVTVTVTRTFNAPAERVFDAWLDPECARQFLFTTPSQVVVSANIDARVGGAFLFVVRRNGRDVDHIGRYLEIDRPRRLVFTLRVIGVWTDDNRVTIDVRSLERGCELTITHDGVLPEHADRIRFGWTEFLGRLGATTVSPNHDMSAMTQEER